MTGIANETERKGLSKSISDFFMTYGFYVLFLLLIFFFSITSHTFFTLSNLQSVLKSCGFLLACAAGTTVVIITGEMDLSVGSIALVATGIMAVLSNQGMNPTAAILVALGVGAVIGLINGVLVAYCRLNSMLVTLGLQIAYRGLGMLITGGMQIALVPSYSNFGAKTVLGFSSIFIVSLVVAIVLHLVLRRTRFGTYCYAMGCNGSGMQKMGINVKKIKLAVFVISGICGAITGMMIVCKLGVVQNTVGQGMEFDAIAAAVIGGTSLLGGKGKVLPGTLLGVMLLYVINDGLAILGSSSFVYTLVEGIIIFIAMYLDALNAFKRK